MFLNIVYFLLINILLILGWSLFVFRKFKNFNFLDKLLTIFILSCLQIFLSIVFLSSIKNLDQISIGVLNAFISFSLSVLFLKQLKFLKEEVFLNFKKIFFIIKNLDTFSKVSIFLLILFSLWLLFLIIIFPPHDWDGLYYHLGWVGYLIQEKGFYYFNTGSFWIDAYPKTIETFSLWSAILLQNGILVEGAQFIFLIFCLLAIINIFLKFNIHNKLISIGVLLFFATPVVYIQASTAYVDLAFSCLFIIALNFLVNIIKIKENIRDNFFILGIVLGLFLGSKYTAISIYIFIVFFIFLQFLISRQYNLKLLFLMILISFIIGGFWYFKNFLEFKNPIYPFSLKLGSFELNGEMTTQEFIEKAYGGEGYKYVYKQNYFKKIFISWTEQYSWTRAKILYTHDNPYAGFGPQWFIILFPSILLAIIFSLLYRKKEFLTFILFGLISFFIIPENYTPRYTIFIVFFGVFSFIFLMQIFNEKLEIYKKTLFVKILLFFSLAFSFLSLFLSVSMGYFSPEIVKNQIKKNPFFDNSISFRGGDFYDCLFNHLKPNTVLIYDENTDFIYPYWNYNFSNTVRYIPSNIPYDLWFSNIKNLKSNFIISRSFSANFNWLLDKEKFKLICHSKDRDLYLFQFLSNY